MTIPQTRMPVDLADLQCMLDEAARQGAFSAREQAAEQAQDRMEADADAQRDLEHDDSEWAERQRGGPSEHDSCDSHGVPLRPLVNDAGEPWYM